jgi:DNA modification methylase
VELSPISALKPDPLNPLQHTKSQIKDIARSIATFGFNVPILIDRNGKIIAGHARWLAAKRLGLAKVPTITLEHLTEAQAKAFMIADNRLAEMSGWDDQRLAVALKELSDLNLDFDIEAIGFTVNEIHTRIEGLSADPEHADIKADAIPAPKPHRPISAPGDLWHLRDHRVLCGNPLDAGVYETLLQGEQAAVVFTGPPPNVYGPGHASEYLTFLNLSCALLVRHSINGSLHFICANWRHAGDLIAAGKANYSELKDVCVWVKRKAEIGSLYRGQHEFIFVFKSGPESRGNMIRRGRNGRNRTNVWRYPGPNCSSRQTEEGDLLEGHLTAKPTRLVADAISDSSARGDIVLDPFLGNGATVIAAERTGRRCFGMEIDPLFVDSIVRRWQACTGESAIHTSSGKRFDELTSRKEASRG